MDCLGDATRTSRVVPSLGWLFRYGRNIGGSVTWAATMDNSCIYPQKFDNSWVNKPVLILIWIHYGYHFLYLSLTIWYISKCHIFCVYSLSLVALFLGNILHFSVDAFDYFGCKPSIAYTWRKITWIYPTRNS